MDQGRWERIKDLLEASLELAPRCRRSFLAKVCGDDTALRSDVEALLEHHQCADGLLEGSLGDILRPEVEASAERSAGGQPAVGGESIRSTKFVSVPADEHSDPVTILGITSALEGVKTLIGRYHLLEKIGEGGMGEVWLAEQKEPIRRRVAVKLVKAGMNSREVVTRFESERQTLALMDHPAIAKVFDAGSSPRGTPYFVMEYVAGVPITEYCDTHRLSTRERLELFVHVCEGVQHAHQKAIMHRDLKPSNILVSEVDGRAAPKIIDFGVAKALTQGLTASTLYTRVGTLVGTPEYMSPEQANSSGEDIDTRTDVYSLGIIFYELLAGVPPLDFRKSALDEFLRRLREEEPPKPSTRIRTLDEATATDLARKRQTEPLALAKQLGGDLDSIALKALEKDRGRRYGSASDFAGDIGRYLRNEAVLAVPASLAYRARKFALRYRGALATAGALVVVLVVATVVSIRQSLRANRETTVAQAVNDFLQNDMLGQASAYNQSKPDPDLKVRTALDRAAARITGKFDRQPEVEASIRNTIGTTYTDLGRYPEAAKQLEAALDLRRRVLGPEHPDTLRSMTNLAIVYLIEGKSAQAEALDDEALAIMHRVSGSEYPDTLRSMSTLANVYWDEGRWAQAEALHSQILDIRHRVSGPEHPDTLSSMNSLAAVYAQEGKYAQAEALRSRALEMYRRVLGPEHPATLNCMTSLANVYAYDGKYAQAEALHSPALEICRRVLGPEHPLTLFVVAALGRMYQCQGKYELAETYAAQALAGCRHSLGAENPGTMASEADLALAYLSRGKFAQSEPVARDALETEKKVEPDKWQRYRAASLLGSSLSGEKRYTEAEPLLLEGYQGMLARKDRIGVPDRYNLDLAHQWIVKLYQAWGKPAKAAEWRKN